MKRSIKHLPKRTLEELNTPLGLITHYVPWCDMVVLFGGYVLWDEKVEFGVDASYQSDYDIMVVVSMSGISKRLGVYLHQACECFYNAISLVFTNYRPKIHKINELVLRVKEYSRELATVFPLHTDFEKRCFDLLCRAYIEARYNTDFVVTKDELTYMFERTEMLKKI